MNNTTMHLYKDCTHDSYETKVKCDKCGKIDKVGEAWMYTDCNYKIIYTTICEECSDKEYKAVTWFKCRNGIFTIDTKRMQQIG